MGEAFQDKVEEVEEAADESLTELQDDPMAILDILEQTPPCDPWDRCCLNPEDSACSEEEEEEEEEEECGATEPAEQNAWLLQSLGSIILQIMSCWPKKPVTFDKELKSINPIYEEVTDDDEEKEKDVAIKPPKCPTMCQGLAVYFACFAVIVINVCITYLLIKLKWEETINAVIILMLIIMNLIFCYFACSKYRCCMNVKELPAIVSVSEQLPKTKITTIVE